MYIAPIIYILAGLNSPKQDKKSQVKKRET